MRAALFLALLLSACQADDPDATSTRGTPSNEESASRPDTAMVRSVSPEQTAALLSDLEVASPSIAIQTIGLWSARLDTLALEGAAADTLASIRDDLETLSGELQSSPLSGRFIGTTLTDLGRKTAFVAEGAPEIAALGQALSAAGRTLAPPDTSGVSTDEESSVQ